MELIDKAKQVINGYYSGDFDKLYIPEDIVGEVFLLAAATVSHIEEFCVFHDQLSDDILFRSTTEYALTSGCALHQIIAFSYIKQVQQYSDFIESIPKSFEKNIAVLSNLDLETMPEPFSFVLFDGRIAIVLEADVNGGYFLTTNKSILDDCRKWLNIPFIDEKSINSSFLQEPLMFSADMMSEAALVLCTHDHMNMDSCYWYHSVWQYLRLMNMVSTPSWHHDFYLKQLSNAIERFDQPRVLISGAADYSSLSYVIHVMKSLNKEGSYSVLDLCQTPLFACKWYAKREQVELDTICASIFELNKYDSFDLICTDAFLTRFSQADMKRVVSIWYKALSSGGSVVTTVRIHDEKHVCPEIPSDNDVELFRLKAYERSKIWGNTINYSQEQVSLMAKTYARKMRSNNLGSKEDILRVFTDVGFVLDFVEDIELQGELYPSRYIRLRAVKGE